MVHQVFEFIGKRVILDVIWEGTEERKLEGIFAESPDYDTMAEGDPRPALDFIEPLYDVPHHLEELAKGIIPMERIHLDNPILCIYMAIDHRLLSYVKIENSIPLFRSDRIFNYSLAAYCNDGNADPFNRYKEALQKAGFKVK